MQISQFAIFCELRNFSVNTKKQKSRSSPFFINWEMSLCLYKGTEILQLTIFVNCEMSLFLCGETQISQNLFFVNCQISLCLCEEDKSRS